MRSVKIGTVSDLASGSMKKVYVDGTEILLANLDGAFYAIADKCPHMGGSLSAGTLEGGTVKCPKHGTVIDIKTGKILQQPKVLFIKANVKNDATVYTVRVHGKDIEIVIV